MQFTIEKSVIITPLRYAAGFTTNKNLSTILQNVYIEADAEQSEITIKATNFQIGFSSVVKANVELGGAVTVSAGKLLEIIGVMPDGEIIFKSEKDKFHINQGSDKSFKLPVMDPALFPKSPQISAEYNFQINGRLLVDILKRVIFCVSTDPARPEYNGVHLSIFVDHVEASASDLQRIANAKATLDEPISGDFVVNIPRIAVTDIIKIFENEPVITVETDKRQISFRGEHTQITSKLIEKTATRITKLIHDTYDIKALISRSKLFDALKMVSAAANEQTFGIRFEFNGSDLGLYSLDSAVEGENRSIKDVEITEKEYATVLNSKLLLEILSNIRTEKVVFNFKQPDKPLLIHPDDESAKYVMVSIITERYL
jgi:DNA polymerase-3 subunit beta